MGIGFDLSMNAAKSAMQTRQKEMAIVANNLAHVNAKYYHRQEAIIAEDQPIPGRAAYFGTGVHVSSVIRYYDESLENSLRNAESNYNYREAYSYTLKQIEDMILPDGEDFLTQAINDFSASVQDVSANPESITARSALIGRANTLAERFNRQYSQMDEVRLYLGEDTQVGNGAIQEKVDELNALGKQLITLNDEIHALESYSFNQQKANDMRDQRDRVVIAMSKLAEITVTEERTYRLTVEIDGHKFIDGEQSGTAQMDDINFTMVKDNDLAQAGSTTSTVVIPNTKVFTNAELAGRMITVGGESRVIKSYDPATFTITLDNPPLSAAPTAGVTTYQIYDPTPTWSSDNSGISFGRGEIAGLIDVRQYIIDRMHELHLYSIDFADITNAIQRTGTFPAGAGNVYDLDGNAVPSPPALGWQDYTFFDANTAGSMTVGITDPRKIAASTLATETGNGINMMNLWEALNSSQTLATTNILDNDSLSSFATTFAGNVAVDIEVANGQTETTSTTREMFQNAVYEVSAVNMDEEMTDMLEVQKAYQAAAKMINVLNSMLDTVLTLV